MSQGGMVSILQDFPMSPDMVSEVKVLTSGYAPEYGSSTVGQIMAVTKSGGSVVPRLRLRVQPDDVAECGRSGAQTPAPFKKNNYGVQHRWPGAAARPDDRQA